MKKNKKKIIRILILVLVISLFILLTYLNLKKNREKQEEQASLKDMYTDLEKEYTEMKESSTMYNDDSTLAELKEEYKITGENDLYEVTTEADGRNVVNVKTSVNYKVAFCGMINKTQPKFEEIESIFEKNNPTKKGVWINSDDRTKILKYLNNNQYTNNEYSINEEGYLNIVNSDNSTETDKEIEKIINSDRQVVLTISSICYMVDTVTGQIVDNPYNDLEEYQTYEYFQDGDRMIVFITENSKSKMTNDDIFGSLMNLLKSVE